MFEVSTDWSIHRFAEAMNPLFLGREAQNNLALGLIERIIRGTNDAADNLLAIVKEGDQAVLGALQTRPHKLVLIGEEVGAAPILAQYLYVSKKKFPGVVGPVGVCRSFASEWLKLTGQSLIQEMPQGVYRLDKVVLPQEVQGRMRYADMGDLRLATDWLLELCNEALPEEGRKRDLCQNLIEGKLADRFLFFWVVGSRPVSTASLSRPARGGVCVNSVYTPKDQRRKGYASMLVAQLSQHALSKGYRYCTLYTDLRNPTSNAIYSKIGYRYLGESLMIFWDT